MDALVGLFGGHPVPLEYSGVDCSNNCLYCFAKAYSCKESDYRKFQSLIRNLDKRQNLAAELFKAGQPVLLSNRSDPFCENNYRETLSVLKLLRQFPNGIYFQTKTGEAIEDVLEILDGKQNVAWYITVTCADDEMSKKVEPGAPPTSERLEWAFDLAKVGYHVIVAFNPLVEAWMPTKALNRIFDKCMKNGIKDFYFDSLHWEKKRKYPDGLLALTERTVGTIDSEENKGSGKTFLTTWLAAHISNGSFFRGEQSAKGAVLFFPPEGKKHKVMRRLRKAGADLSLCSVIDSKFDNEGNIVPLNMKTHDELNTIINDYETIKQVKVRAVIIDPVGIYLGGTKNSDYGEVSALLAPLAKIGTERNISFILIQHHRKGLGEYGGDSTMGSQAWNTVPRMTWQVHAPKNDTIRYFIPDKNSDGESKGFSFRIVSDEPKTTGYLVIEDDEIDHTADSIITQNSEPRESKIDQCCQWLQEAIPCEGKDRDDVIAEGKVQVCMKLGDFLFRLCLR